MTIRPTNSTTSHYSFAFIGLALTSFTLYSCGPTTPSAQQPRKPANSSSPQTPKPPLVYSKFTDPLYLAFSEEQNVYGRRTLARLWVAVAQTDPSSDAQQARLKEAQAARAISEQAVANEHNACKARVDMALDRATRTKNKLEQKFLEVSEQAGGDSPKAKQIDVQVHLLRDEIESLRVLADPCPKAMYDESPHLSH